ncbi:MAG: CBS domain-containing protein [Candidatus Lokiarchaeota archaeon]|nr:CBS domain-containing protein [Candidatus Lokiarchaeota archaeon]
MKLGTIKGIGIKLHISTLLIVGLVGFYAATFYSSFVENVSLIELIAVGIINGFIILFSILIHELSHSLMAQRYGLKVSEIELYLFGGVSKIEEEPRTPKSEFIISFVGPLSSILLGLIFLGTLFFSPFTYAPWISITLLYSGISNIGLGIFNLLPAFPMDGGRVLRAYLWNRKKDLLSATKTASRIGSFIGYGLMFLGFLQILFLGVLGGFWLILIGSFLSSSAKKSYIQTVNDVALSKISVKDLISIPKVTIPYETLVSEALKDYFMVYRESYFPVIRRNEIVGIVYLNDLLNIPPEDRQFIILGYVMRKASDFPAIRREDNAKDVVREFQHIDSKPHMVVVREHEDEEVIGFIGENELNSALRFLNLTRSAS